MKISFYLDNMKVTHYDHQENTIFIEWLKQKYKVEVLNEIKEVI